MFGYNDFKRKKKQAEREGNKLPERYKDRTPILRGTVSTIWGVRPVTWDEAYEMQDKRVASIITDSIVGLLEKKKQSK